MHKGIPQQDIIIIQRERKLLCTSKRVQKVVENIIIIIMQREWTMRFWGTLKRQNNCSNNSAAAATRGASFLNEVIKKLLFNSNNNNKRKTWICARLLMAFLRTNAGAWGWEKKQEMSAEKEAEQCYDCYKRGVKAQKCHFMTLCAHHCTRTNKLINCKLTTQLMYCGII